MSNKNPIKIDNNTGICTVYLFDCHDVRVDNSKVCKACIDAQRNDLADRVTQITAHLESGKSLTKLQCISLYRYINLGDIIYKLRRDNNDPDYIKTEMRVSKVTGFRYAVYTRNKKK